MSRRPPTSHKGAATGRIARRAGPRQAVSLQAKIAWGFSFLVVVIGLLWLIWPVFSMLVASAAFAYMLDPIVDRFERNGWTREVGIGIIFGLTVVILVLLGFVIVPAVAEQVSVLSHNIGAYLAQLEGHIQPAALWIEKNLKLHIPVDWAELKANIPGWVKKVSPDARATIQGYVTGVFTSGIGFFLAIFNLALLPIFTFFLLRDWDRLVTAIDALIPPRYRPRVRHMGHEVDSRLRGFVQGQIYVAGILAVLYSIGLTFSRIDMPWLVGMTAGFLFVIPYVGTVLGIIVGSILALLKFGLDWHIVAVVLSFAIPQALEGLVITPRIMGDNVGLHPMVVMVALLVGGNLLGIWGMLVAIPITAIFSVFGSEWLRNYRASQVYGDEAKP